MITRLMGILGLTSKSVVTEELIITRQWQYLNYNEHIFVPIQVPLRTFDLTKKWWRTSKTSSETVGVFLQNTSYSDYTNDRQFEVISVSNISKRKINSPQPWIAGKCIAHKRKKDTEKYFFQSSTIHILWL